MEKQSLKHLETIKTRSINGVIMLTIRTIFVQVFSFFSIFILTILLEPSIFGVFFLVSAIINLFIYFSDVGLAAALIQKKEEPDKEDFNSTFLIQQFIVLTLVAIGLVFSSQIADFYKLNNGGLVLLRVLIFSLFLSSLKTIPSVILERDLQFGKLIIPQVAENIIFYTVAIWLAYKGFGLSSFSYAVLARGLLGLVLIFVVSPWKPGVTFNVSSLKKLISFGIPFQLNSVLALLKDDLLTIILGRILPFSHLGYLGWAQKWSFVPLRFFMDGLIKVSFPVYSKLQSDSEFLKKAIEKSLYFVTFTVYPASLGILLVAPQIVSLIPKYHKWEPALPLLTFYTLNALFASVNTTLTNILFALGKPKIILKLMVFWTILTWISTYFLIQWFGYLGVAIASALVAASTTIVVYFVKKDIKVNILSAIKNPTIASLVMFAVVKVVISNLEKSVLTLILTIIMGFIVYIGTLYLLEGKKLKEHILLILNSYTKKSN